MIDARNKPLLKISCNNHCQIHPRHFHVVCTTCLPTVRQTNVRHPLNHFRNLLSIILVLVRPPFEGAIVTTQSLRHWNLIIAHHFNVITDETFAWVTVQTYLTGPGHTKFAQFFRALFLMPSTIFVQFETGRKLDSETCFRHFNLQGA